MEIAARPVEEDSKPDQGCPIQDHRHNIAINWFKCDFKSGLAQTQHLPAVGIPVLETLLKLRIATLMVCLFISSTSFTSVEYLISIIKLKWSTAVGVLGLIMEPAAKLVEEEPKPKPGGNSIFFSSQIIRTCSSPSPSCGGKTCPGSAHRQTSCNNQCCGNLI